eukprot:scaffold77868_cov31-Tisochrysis_lutea.AAC.2
MAHQPQNARLAVSWHSAQLRSCAHSRSLCEQSLPNQPMEHLQPCASPLADGLGKSRQTPWLEHSGVPGHLCPSPSECAASGRGAPGKTL